MRRVFKGTHLVAAEMNDVLRETNESVAKRDGHGGSQVVVLAHVAPVWVLNESELDVSKELVRKLRCLVRKVDDVAVAAPGLHGELATRQRWLEACFCF